jgi:hypothetical protein
LLNAKSSEEGCVSLTIAIGYCVERN